MAATSRRTPHESKHPHLHEMLDTLLALDKMVIEVSMNLYDIGHRDRSRMRSQNRRLHAAVRKHLPKFFQRSRLRG